MSPHPLVRLGQGDYTRDHTPDPSPRSELGAALAIHEAQTYARRVDRLRLIEWCGWVTWPFRPPEHPCPDCGEDMEWMPYQPREYDTNVPECPAGWWCQECERLDEHYTDSPDRTEDD